MATVPVRQVLSGRKRIETYEVESLLEFINTITILTSTEKFVAKDRFIVNTSDDALVKIAYISNSFTEAFLQDEGKTEDQITEEQILRCSKLRRSSVDTPIIVELGEDKAEIFLREFWHLLENQPSGNDGILLTNGYANIFYIRNSRGVFYAVDAYWRRDGWNLDVYSVENPNEWDAGSQIVSRNS